MYVTSLRLSPDKRTLTVTFDDATTHALTAHRLRVESPSAEVKGHFGVGGQTPIGKEDVTISALEPVGHYAVKITFSDGHASGLFTWDYLRALAQKA